MEGAGYFRGGRCKVGLFFLRHCGIVQGVSVNVYKDVTLERVLLLPLHKGAHGEDSGADLFLFSCFLAFCWTCLGTQGSAF